MTGTVVFLSWITRADLQSNPDSRYVFGDNTQRVGLGGQAGAMRGEPNAIGVATKWAPGMSDADFFADDDPRALGIVDADIDKVVDAMIEGRRIFLPLDGLGTGLSQLPTRAPKLHHHIVNRFRAISGPDFPWGE